MFTQIMNLQTVFLKVKKSLQLMKNYARLPLIAVIVLVCLTSCQSFQKSNLKPFEDLYRDEPFFNTVDSVHVKSEPLLTFSANKLPLSSFVRVISDYFKIGVVFSEELGQKTITAEIKNTDLKSVLGIISRQIQVDVINIGNTYYIGNLRPQDRGLLVRKMYGHTSLDLSNIINPLLSTQGKVYVTENQIVIVADHEAVLKKCSEALDFVHNSEITTLIVQLYFVSLRKNNMIDGGLSTKSSGKVSYDLQQNKVHLDDLKLEALFSFDASNSYADVFASPMLIMRDGTASKWTDGETVPIPKKTVSDRGVISTTGFDYVNTGYTLNVIARRAKNQKINLELTTQLSEIKDYIEGVPVTVGTNFSIDVDLLPNKLYLLGELSTIKNLNKWSQALSIDYKASKTTIQVCGKCYQISGNVLNTQIPVYGENEVEK